MSNLFFILPAPNHIFMRKLYFLPLFILASITGFAQLTTLKSGGSSMFGGASLGNKVVYVNFSNGALGATDGTVGGTIDIPTAVLAPSPSEPVAGALNNKIIFTGTDIITGVELWASDGTVGGTIRLMDINPGAGNAYPQGGTDGFTVVNSNLYFTADDGTGIRKLYKTNGTAAGTSLVKDLGNVTIAFPFMMSPVGTNVYFTVNGKQLWKSDGTTLGTVMVKDFSPGSATTFSTFFVGAGSYTFFLANDGTNGLELWRTDGSAAGTIMLANYGAGASDGFTLFGGQPDWNVNTFNNMVFFQPNGTGMKLYKTDGSVVGTTLVTDLNPGGGGGMNLSSSLTVWNNFYFQANTGIYKSDGTAGGTTLVKSIGPNGANILRPRDNFGTGVAPGNFAGGRFFFIADDGTNGKELWVSDGTNAGTFMLKNIATGAANAFSGNDDVYFYTKYKLYFAADDGTNGKELWETDGTTLGTVMTMNINPGVTSSSPDIFGVSLTNNKLVLTATDASGNNIYALNATVVSFPLSLTDFTAQLRSAEISLNWTTQNEVNVSHFNVQRSITGKDFSTIARVNATGVQNTNNYGFTDVNYGKSGILYYRLEIIDKDGKVSYSKIQTIKLRTEFDFNVSSSKNETFISLGDVNGIANIKITDASGRVQAQQKQKITAGEMIRLSTMNLASGIYYVTVELNGNIQTRRFIK